MREYRILVTHRYSARWAGRYNKFTSGDVNLTFPVDDAMILCDLCNKSYPEASDTEILILQHRWYSTEPWNDVGTRCPDCQEGLENLPKLEEDRIVKCPECKKEYTPELPPRPEGDRRMIQAIYPNAEPYQTEQLIVGICSDKCFDGERTEYTYDEKGRRFENGERKLFADPPRD